ncbi:hypothetical protein FE697_015620 [Mumia zhuanghuii]|uniref:PH domain-containing protein n=2 Tax=Mumia TaxID=1546255 RepID=A0ABW1QPR8_9ACTN|nr:MULTISPECIES: hypothetical protein [Mumia]KAA1420394.1 hypothetical protein FE697_015620 [Mumia zhuanghuii]
MFAIALVAALRALDPFSASEGLVSVLGGVAAVWAFTLALAALTIRTTRIEVVDGRLQYTRFTGWRVVAEVAQTRGLVGSFGRRGPPVLIIVDADNRRVLRVDTDVWRDDQLMAIAQQCGYDVDPSVRSRQQWKSRLPGSVNVLGRRTPAVRAASVTMTSALTAVVAVLAVVGGIAIGISIV